MINDSTESIHIESFNYTKKLIIIGISNIVYVRAVFPEDCFISRELDGLNVKILNKRHTNLNVKKMFGWLSGAFEAMEKKYVSLFNNDLY